MEDLEVKNFIFEHLNKIGTLPFLFIGSGFSKRYLDTENWENLLKRFALEGKCKDINRYISSVEDGRNNLEKVASALSLDFYEKWWELEQFKESREIYKNQIINQETPLKLEISNYFKNININEKIEKLSASLKDEIKVLKKINVDGIFTTNYDLLLENIFKNYDIYVNQKNILNSQSYGINEIYKIHGCCTNFSNIILTENDYKNFEKENEYVIAKLLTIFIEHPVLFLGYSLNDKYIQKIISSIAKIVGKDNLDKLKDKFIFISYNRDGMNNVTEREIVIETNSLTITKIDVSTYLPVFQSLAELKRKIPSKILRYMKEEIYEFTKNSESKEKFGVIDLENITEENYNDIEFIVGVGVKKKFSEKGFSTFTNEDIFRKILIDDGDDFHDEDYKKLLEITITDLKRKQPSINLPFNKFLSLSKKSIDDLDIELEIKLKLKEFNNQDLIDSTMKNTKSSYENTSLEEILENEETSLGRKLVIITALKDENINLNLLHDFLVENIDILELKSNPDKSKFYKVVCVYDRLKYTKISLDYSNN